MIPQLEARAPPRSRSGRPHLTPRLEQKLVREARGSDTAARARLVDAFLPLIGSVAGRYLRPGVVDRVELIQAGVLGLLRALERYDPERGSSFWAYASWWVRQAMQQLVAEVVRPVVLSDRALRQLARIKGARSAHLQEHGGEPTMRQLAATTGIDKRQVESLLAAERPPLALDEPVRSDDGRAGTLGELVPDPRAGDELDRVVRWLETEDLTQLTAELTDRERAVLSSRYGLDCPAQTLREIAASFDLSAERVRQIEQEALGKLRHAASP